MFFFLLYFVVVALGLRPMNKSFFLFHSKLENKRLVCHSRAQLRGMRWRWWCTTAKRTVEAVVHHLHEGGSGRANRHRGCSVVVARPRRGYGRHSSQGSGAWLARRAGTGATGVMQADGVGCRLGRQQCYTDFRWFKKRIRTVTIELPSWHIENEKLY